MNDSSAASALVYANRRAQLRTLIDHRSAGNIAAFADQFGYSRSRVSQFLSDTYNEGRSIGERAARALEEAAVVPFGWLDTRNSLADTTTTTHGAKLRAAIADARHVFGKLPDAMLAVDYFDQVLACQVVNAKKTAAGAPVPAQTGITPGAENASIAKESPAIAGAAATPVAGSEWPAWAHELDKVTAEVGQIAAETINVFGQLANILSTVGATTLDQAATAAKAADPVRTTAAQQADITRQQAAIDQAAAAMAAESAKKVADAEWFASRCTTAAPAPVDAASTPAIVSRLMVEVDTTQLDAALAKAEQLKVALAGLAPHMVLP